MTLRFVIPYKAMTEDFHAKPERDDYKSRTYATADMPPYKEENADSIDTVVLEALPYSRSVPETLSQAQSRGLTEKHYPFVLGFRVVIPT